MRLQGGVTMPKRVDMGNDPDGDLEEIDAVSAYPVELRMAVNSEYGKYPMVPYISTDRADLQRVIEHAHRIRATLDTIPAAHAKVTAAQWSALTHELHAFVTLARRIEGRINA